MRTATSLAALLLCACASAPAPHDARSPLAPLAWFSGTWVGGEGSMHIEETWSGPSGVSMLGSFRMLENGAPRFYELMSLEREGEHTLLRLKHFGPKLHAWEEKDEAPTFRLSAVTGSEATFENVGTDKVRRIRYQRTGDALVITLERDGKPPQLFRFRRAGG
jgi:Domain of unknown function (DUF6265)